MDTTIEKRSPLLIASIVFSCLMAIYKVSGIVLDIYVLFSNYDIHMILSTVYTFFYALSFVFVSLSLMSNKRNFSIPTLISALLGIAVSIAGNVYDVIISSADIDFSAVLLLITDLIISVNDGILLLFICAVISELKKEKFVGSDLNGFYEQNQFKLPSVVAIVGLILSLVSIVIWLFIILEQYGFSIFDMTFDMFVYSGSTILALFFVWGLHVLGFIFLFVAIKNKSTTLVWLYFGFNLVGILFSTFSGWKDWYWYSLVVNLAGVITSLLAAFVLIIAFGKMPSVKKALNAVEYYSLNETGSPSDISDDSVIEELYKLKELFDLNIITEQEYNAEKAKLLGTSPEDSLPDLSEI